MNDESWKKLSERHADELERLATQSDGDIDFSEIPEQNPEDWVGAYRGDQFRPRKDQITLRLDADVIAWFRAHFPKYQTAMNAALRSFMDAHVGSNDDQADSNPDESIDDRKTA